MVHAARGSDDIRERLVRVVDRSEGEDAAPMPERRNYARERLKEIMDKDAGRDGQAAVHKLDGHSEYDMGEDAARASRSLSIWFDPEMVWTPPPTGKRGRQCQFSDAAIWSCPRFGGHSGGCGLSCDELAW